MNNIKYLHLCCNEYPPDRKRFAATLYLDCYDQLGQKATTENMFLRIPRTFFFMTLMLLRVVLRHILLYVTTHLVISITYDEVTLVR